MYFHTIHYTFPELFGLWRSLVARSLGVREVGGSNPLSPTSSLIQSIVLMIEFAPRSKAALTWL